MQGLRSLPQRLKYRNYSYKYIQYLGNYFFDIETIKLKRLRSNLGKN